MLKLEDFTLEHNIDCMKSSIFIHKSYIKLHLIIGLPILAILFLVLLIFCSNHLKSIMIPCGLIFAYSFICEVIDTILESKTLKKLTKIVEDGIEKEETIIGNYESVRIINDSIYIYYRGPELIEIKSIKRRNKNERNSHKS